MKVGKNKSCKCFFFRDANELQNLFSMSNQASDSQLPLKYCDFGATNLSSTYLDTKNLRQSEIFHLNSPAELKIESKHRRHA